MLQLKKRAVFCIAIMSILIHCNVYSAQSSNDSNDNDNFMAPMRPNREILPGSPPVTPFITGGEYHVDQKGEAYRISSPETMARVRNGMSAEDSHSAASGSSIALSSISSQSSETATSRVAQLSPPEPVLDAVAQPAPPVPGLFARILSSLWSSTSSSAPATTAFRSTTAELADNNAAAQPSSSSPSAPTAAVTSDSSTVSVGSSAAVLSSPLPCPKIPYQRSYASVAASAASTRPFSSVPTKVVTFSMPATVSDSGTSSRSSAPPSGPTPPVPTSPALAADGTVAQSSFPLATVTTASASFPRSYASVAAAAATTLAGLTSRSSVPVTTATFPPSRKTISKLGVRPPKKIVR